MKKLITISAMLLVVLFVSSVAYAASDSDQVAVLLTVGPIFSIDIEDSVLDWGEVAQGAAGYGGTTMYCSTNQGNPWTILVNATPVIGGTTGAEIPMDPNFKFSTYALPDWGGTPSAGTFVDPPVVLSTVDQLAYTAAASEYSDTDCRVGLFLVLDVPYGQTADTYASTVTATMTE